MKVLRFGLVLAVLLTITSVGAYAATNIYSDTYTTEDSSGHWTFTSMETSKLLETTSVISATPATLTAVSSGTTYIVDSTNASTPNATIVTVVLPVAADQLMYKFISGDASVIVIEVSDSNFTALYSDTIAYGTVPATNVSLRLTGATGSTLEVHGDSDGLWYVSDVVGTWTPETKT